MKTKTQPRFKKGCNLIEILIVVAILGLLAGLAIPNFMKARKAAQEKAAAAEAAKLSNSVPAIATPAK